MPLWVLPSTFVVFSLGIAVAGALMLRHGVRQFKLLMKTPQHY
ncbi:hypothetical protein AAW51_4148 [Caldimonas brevitalea]|uniref:Uncharacterized protein n=2 Tax=Caldimonas brevitalea TaxID=413882 RepID=A0A0G3BN15_9BURK|nr:hypothetical protein AAW51_4148 [Caldimonas brevitalea]